MGILQKEKVLLGYSRSPQRSRSPSHDSNSSPKTPSRSSDIDFSDVFGGPPRRASPQEMQTRYHDDHDNSSCRGDGVGNDETVMGRSSWSSNPGGKPVFGAENVGRRRNQSEDFFDDIFGGAQSLSSSPRMGSRDPLSSAPGSRVLIPARTLPPGVEPLGSPAHFSLPARLASSQSLNTSMTRLSGQAVHNHDVFQAGDAFSFYRRSPLTHGASSNGEELKNDFKVDGSDGIAQVPNGGNQFHFSIHKWASKGVPLAIALGRRKSLRSKEKNKLDKSLSLDGSVELESDTLVAEIQPADSNTDDFVPFNVHVISAARERKESDQIFEKSVTDAPKSRPNNKVESGNSAISVGSVPYFSEERQDPALPKNSSSTETEKVSTPDTDANKSDLKQSSKLHGIEGRSGNDGAIPEARGNQKVVERKLATSLDVDNVASHEEVEKSKLKESSGFKGGNKKNNINHQKNMVNDTNREKVTEKMGNDRIREKVKEDMGSNRAKGKVKEFVKIFNQEPSSKPAGDFNGKSPSSRWRTTDVSRANSKRTLSSTKTDEKIQSYDVNCRLDSPPKVDENNIPLNGEQFDGSSIQEPCQSSHTKNENLGSTMGLASDGFEASGTNIDVTYESILIEELPEILDKSPEGSENHEDIQTLESKILKWSKGKEGNIRAQLSTLQYVLWPNSGWKPVPLVNIIEGNAVKRSYQRALLCLHPDKLQQKGAAFDQKFIAEKVFDILQEAWDHFNTLGSL